MSGRQIRVQQAPSTGNPALDTWLQQLERVVNTLPSDSTTTTVTADYSVPFHAGTILWNGASLGTLTLPSDTTYYGARYDIKNISGNTVVLDPNGATQIDGAASASLVTLNWSYTVVFDGTVYRLL